MGVSAEARFGDCPRVFMRLDAVCEEPSHWETGPNETVSAGIKGGNRRASSVWNTSAFRLPYALLVALNDPSKSPSTPATCAKSPARPCVFVLTKGMSLIGPRPERPAFCAEFEKRIHGWHYRTMVTPGLSGLAQVTGGYDLLPKEKVVLDLWRPSPRRSRRAAPAAPQVDSVDVDMRIGAGQRPVAPLVDGFERLLVQI